VLRVESCLAIGGWWSIIAIERAVFVAGFISSAI
jgi:hypothetical protein